MNYIDTRFLFCGTTVPADRALMSPIREATQALALFWLLLITSAMTYLYFELSIKEYWIVLFCYNLIESTGPLLVFIGTSLLDATLTYAGYIVFSIFTILEVGRIVYVVLVWRYLFPPMETKEIIISVILGILLMLIRIYVNYVFFSCMKQMPEKQELVYEQTVVTNKNVSMDHQQVNKQSNQYVQYIPPERVPDIVSN